MAYNSLSAHRVSDISFTGGTADGIGEAWHGEQVKNLAL
jgi:hypothetical protein